MPIERLTPKALYDLYVTLPNDDQRAFLRLVADIIGAEMFFDMTSRMSNAESEVYIAYFAKELWDLTFPKLLHTAIQKVRENPDMTERELAKIIHQIEYDKSAEHYQAIVDLEAEKIKSKRDRKHDPSIVARNVEICNRRKIDPKKWSLKKLARAYKRSVRAIQKVLDAESEWRKLANQSEPR